METTMYPTAKLASAIGSIFALTALASCASVTQLESAAISVQEISQNQSAKCRFLGTISANNNNTLSKNPEQDARNKAYNTVAQKGGNSIRITSTNVQVAPSGIGSIFNLSGEAYDCGNLKK
jgi:hypothetical protein